MLFAMLTHWVPLTVSLASHLLDILSTMVWLGLATCWRRTSERILSVCSLHALSFVSRGFTKSWVGQVALRSPINRHALDLTVSLDDQGQQERISLTGPWCHLFDLYLPRLRVPLYGFLATGSPRLTAFGSSVTGKAPC